MKPLTIGKAARQAGVGVETVRFYERQGLIPEPARSDSGYRHYPQSAVSRLRFIRRAKELGFSLKEISELLSLRVDPATTCADVKEKAEDKICSIQRKICDLQRMKKALRQADGRLQRPRAEQRMPHLGSHPGGRGGNCP